MTINKKEFEDILVELATEMKIEKGIIAMLPVSGIVFTTKEIAYHLFVNNQINNENVEIVREYLKELSENGYVVWGY